MTLSEFKALLESHDVKPEIELSEDLHIVDLGVDSFEILMVLGDLENIAGKALDLSLDSTIGELLAKMTAAGK